MLSLTSASTCFASKLVPHGAHASGVVMSALDRSPEAVDKRAELATVGVTSTIKPVAKFNSYWQEGLDRVGTREDDGDGARGPIPLGPPFNEATGLGWDTSTEPKNKEDMMALAKRLNPVVGFYDPLNIVTENTAPETIGWFRHAEIKHGRVAMAAFVGYIVHANGIHFPWNIQAPLDIGFIPSLTKDLPTISFADISNAGSGKDIWDALPTAAKAQILCVIGFLEMHGENSVALERDGQTHYVRGGKPGYYPSFKGIYPHAAPLDLWDPFGFTRNLSAERKEKALLAEVNNGRLAMIGIFGVISASKGLIVPGLDNLGIKPYAGEIMAPFTAADSGLPFVEDMVKNIGSYGY